MSGSNSETEKAVDNSSNTEHVDSENERMKDTKEKVAKKSKPIPKKKNSKVQPSASKK